MRTYEREDGSPMNPHIKVQREFAASGWDHAPDAYDEKFWNGYALALEWADRQVVAGLEARVKELTTHEV